MVAPAEDIILANFTASRRGASFLDFVDTEHLLEKVDALLLDELAAPPDDDATKLVVAERRLAEKVDEMKTIIRDSGDPALWLGKTRESIKQKMEEHRCSCRRDAGDRSSDTGVHAARVIIAEMYEDTLAQLEPDNFDPRLFVSRRERERSFATHMRLAREHRGLSRSAVKKKKQNCRDFVNNGFCPRGSRCTLAHPTPTYAGTSVITGPSASPSSLSSSSPSSASSSSSSAAAAAVGQTTVSDKEDQEGRGRGYCFRR